LLTPAARGREQARRLGESLRHERLAAVYTGALPRGVRTAEIVAGLTGAPAIVREGLRDDYVAELEALADLHRGETVLVVSHSGALRAAVPALMPLEDGAFVEVAIDADGWNARRPA
jgi:broad specificity phosphatase PhoE